MSDSSGTFRIYLYIARDNFPQLAQESPEEWYHWAFRHRESASKRMFVFGRQKGRGEILHDWDALVHASFLPNRLQLVGSAT